MEAEVDRVREEMRELLATEMFTQIAYKSELMRNLQDGFAVLMPYNDAPRPQRIRNIFDQRAEFNSLISQFTEAENEYERYPQLEHVYYAYVQVMLWRRLLNHYYYDFRARGIRGIPTKPYNFEIRLGPVTKRFRAYIDRDEFIMDYLLHKWRTFYDPDYLFDRFAPDAVPDVPGPRFQVEGYNNDGLMDFPDTDDEVMEDDEWRRAIASSESDSAYETGDEGSPPAEP